MPPLPPIAPPAARALAKMLGVSVTLGDVLVGRGITTEPSAQRYLRPLLSHLTSPAAMIGRDEACSRLAEAIKRRERVAIFGDYDCDGITAAAIMTDAVRTLGGTALPMLASRFDGGYGLSDKAIERVLAARPGVLVTCDCGSADGPRVLRAKKAGIDVIVIDHHLVPPEPLEALAFLNPHRPECGFPYKGLASCGLALSVAAALRARLGVTLDLKAYLDLVAIGTIADVAPLDGDNRPLVRAGLEAIRGGQRPGIRALAEQARLELSTVFTAEDVSFSLAPRLNAPGRMGDPMAALNLLLARDLTEARSAAAACEQANVQRKDFQARMIDEATALAMKGDTEGRAAIVLAREGWHPGVVGIVAGRLAGSLRMPAIVASIEGPVATGSVRTSDNIPIFTALERCKDLLLGFGGHQKAAGVTFKPERLHELSEAFSAACAGLLAEMGDRPEPSLAEVRFDASDEPWAVVRDFTLLEPCGEANRAPSLCLVGVKVRSAREVKGGHLKADLDLDGRILGAFGFNLGYMAGSLGGRVHVVGQLRRDAWRGGEAVEIKAESIHPA